MLPEYIQRTKDAEFKKSKIMEATFFDEAKERGYDIKKSNSHDDMYKHIDFYLKKGGQSFSVDVKGRKKIHRKSNSFDDIHTWVEFKNVRGKPGWLYGDADYIVFEQESRYIFIDRKDLLNYCLDSVEDIHVTSPLVVVSTQAELAELINTIPEMHVKIC